MKRNSLRPHPGLLFQDGSHGGGFYFDWASPAYHYADSSGTVLAVPGTNTVGRSLCLAPNAKGENRDAIQTTGGARMTYTPNVFGSLPGIQSPAGASPTQSLQGAFTQTLTAGTLIMVTKSITVPNPDDLQIFSLCKDFVTNPWADASCFSVKNGAGGAGSISFSRQENLNANGIYIETTFDTAAHLWVFSFDHATQKAYVWKDGGVALTDTSYSDTSLMSPAFFTIGSTPSYPIPSEFYYAELQFIPRSVSPSNLTELNTILRPYVNWRYGQAGITVGAFS